MIRAGETAALIWGAWCEGRLLDGLPDAARPATVAEADAAQAALEAAAGRRAGWKLAATSRAGQAHINVSGPLPGRLFARFALPAHAPIPTSGMHMNVVEPEFVFRMARDLPGTGPYSADEVLAAVAALHVGLELPDSRFRDFAAAGEAQLVADDACAGRYLLGHAAPEHWRDSDLATTSVHVAVDGEPAAEGSGANVLGDPRIALTWLANELPARGAALHGGDIVFTGVTTVPVPVLPGMRLVATFGDGLGRIAADFATS